MGEDLILVGTQTAHLWVYDVTEATFVHAMNKLPDAVVCLLHARVEPVDHVFAGLANGQLAMYTSEEIIKAAQYNEDYRYWRISMLFQTADDVPGCDQVLEEIALRRWT